MTRPEILAQLTDEMALTCTLLGEAAGEPVESQIAVACVVRNRVDRQGRWGKTFRDVCLMPAQFSCWSGTTGPGAENTARVFAAAEALLAKEPMGRRTVLSQISWIADGIVDDQIADITRHADHYLTERLFLSLDCPSWAADRVPVAHVGHHVFLRLEI